MGKMIGSWSPQVPAGSPSGIPWNSYLRGVDVIKVRQTTHAAVRGVHSAVEHHHLAPRSTTACAEMFENGGFRPILGVAIWIGHDDSLVEVWLRLNLTRCTKSLSWRQQNWWSGRAWERGISSMGWPYFDMQNIFTLGFPQETMGGLPPQNSEFSSVPSTNSGTLEFFVGQKWAKEDIHILQRGSSSNTWLCLFGCKPRGHQRDNKPKLPHIWQSRDSFSKI